MRNKRQTEPRERNSHIETGAKESVFYLHHVAQSQTYLRIMRHHKCHTEVSQCEAKYHSLGVVNSKWPPLHIQWCAAQKSL